MTIQELNREFYDRALVQINAGGNDDFLVMAIPITTDEAVEIADAYKHKAAWNNIDIKEMLAIGDVFEPTSVVLRHLKYKDVIDVNTDSATRSYYHPPTKRCPSREDKDMAIAFESAHVAWNYYAKILSNNPKHREVLIIKTK